MTVERAVRHAVVVAPATGRAPGTYQRGHGLTMANLGRSVAGQYRHEEAVGLWAKALDFMGGVVSDRNRQRSGKSRRLRPATAGAA